MQTSVKHDLKPLQIKKDSISTISEFNYKEPTIIP